MGTAAQGKVRALWEKSKATALLFIGCGSTYYLSLTAAAVARSLGLVATGLPSSELWGEPDSLRGLAAAPAQTVLVAVSRSGETSETLHAVELFRRQGGRAVVCVTCAPASRLAAASDLVLAIPDAQEQSMAQTRSFTSMLVVCRMLVAAIVGDGALAQRMTDLPALGRRVINENHAWAERTATNLSIQRFYFLGSGLCHGLAQECMLKMKEMSLSYSEAYHVLEFRHGPKSMLDGSSLVIGLLTDAVQERETAVLSDMRDLGGRSVAFVEAGTRDDCGPAFVLPLASQRQQVDRLVLYLPTLQLLAYHRAIAKGLDPDLPRNLSAVITL